jgi:hypothetical protein
MASRRTIFTIGLILTFSYAGWDWLQRNVEIVTLHAIGEHDDYFPNLLIVDDGEDAWIRAERPDRFWLEGIRTNPHVTVHRGDQDVRYNAKIWDGESSREHIDALFRAKYGVIDRISAFVWQRDEVPIRLSPR